MNPLYVTVFHTVVGQRRRCSFCGRHQTINRLDRDKRYHCRYCHRPFRKADLAGQTRRRH